MFNNFIFDKEQIPILNNFMQSGRIVVLIDPPFGGRVEPLTNTLKKLTELFLTSKNSNNKIGKLLNFIKQQKQINK